MGSSSVLGWLPPVVIRKLNDLLAKGINPTALAATLAEVEGLDQEEAFRRTRALLDEALEGSCERKEELVNQVGKLERALDRSTRWLNFSRAQFRYALNTSLRLSGDHQGDNHLALIPRDASQAAQDPDRAIWEFPSAEQLPGGEAAWGDVLDARRPPRQPGQKLWQWRKETQLQPVVFQDPQEVNADRVHLHLEHPLVMRLLNRFLLLLELGDIADAEELKAVRRQVSDNWRYGEQRLASIDTDLEREPERIRRTFALQTHRVEPAGAIYLWPQY